MLVLKYKIIVIGGKDQIYVEVGSALLHTVNERQGREHCMLVGMSVVIGGAEEAARTQLQYPCLELGTERWYNVMSMVSYGPDDGSQITSPPPLIYTHTAFQ